MDHGGGGGGGDNIKEEDEDNKLRKLTREDVEAELQKTGFLDASIGIREHHFARDPVIAIFEAPEMMIPVLTNAHDAQNETKEEYVVLIDALLEGAHQGCSRAFGEKYDSFRFIQETMENLRVSRDTRAKQFMFFCLLAIEPGLQDALKSNYVPESRELDRVPELIAAIRKQLGLIVHSPFTQYNVDNLLAGFFRAVYADGYQY